MTTGAAEPVTETMLVARTPEGEAFALNLAEGSSEPDRLAFARRLLVGDPPMFVKAQRLLHSDAGAPFALAPEGVLLNLATVRTIAAEEIRAE